MPQLSDSAFMNIPHIKERIDIKPQRDNERIVTQRCCSGKNNNQLIILTQMTVSVLFIVNWNTIHRFAKEASLVGVSLSKNLHESCHNPHDCMYSVF